MRNFRQRRIPDRDRLRLAPCIGHPPQCFSEGAEQNRTARTPASTLPPETDRAQDLSASASRRNSAQCAIPEEPKRLTVRRPEWVRRIVGALHDVRVDRIELADPQAADAVG